MNKTKSIDNILKPLTDAVAELHRHAPSCNGSKISVNFLKALSDFDRAIKHDVTKGICDLTETIRGDLSPAGLIEMATNDRKFKDVLKGALDLDAVRFMLNNMKQRGVAVNQVNAEDILKSANYNKDGEGVSTTIASKLAAMLTPEYVYMENIMTGGAKTIKYNDGLVSLSFLLQQSASLLADELEFALVNKVSDFRNLLTIVENIKTTVNEINSLRSSAFAKDESDFYSYLNAMKKRKGLSTAYGETQVSLIDNDLLDDLCNQVETVDHNRPVKYKMVKEVVADLTQKVDTLANDPDCIHKYTFEEYLSHMDTTEMEADICKELRYIQTTDESLHMIGFNTIEDFVKFFVIKLITTPLESRHLAKFLKGDILSDVTERVPVRNGLYINIDRSETFAKLNEAYKYNTKAENDLDIDETVRIMNIVMPHLNKHISKKYDFVLKLEGTFSSIKLPQEKFIILPDVYEKLDKLAHCNSRALIMESVSHQEDVTADALLHKLPYMVLVDNLSAYANGRAVGALGVATDEGFNQINTLRELGVNFDSAESGVLPLYNIANIGFGEQTIAYVEFINKYGFKVKVDLDTPIIQKEHEAILIDVLETLGLAATTVIPVYDDIDIQVPYMASTTMYNRIYELVFIYIFNNIRNNIIEILSHVTGEYVEGVNPNGI